MKTFLFSLVILALPLIGGCFLWAPAPKLTTYSLDVAIELVNDCDGNGASNPKSVTINTKLWYTSDTVNATRTWITKVPLVLQADGITSKGDVLITDVPTNLVGHRWDISFPRSCAVIPCDDGKCENYASNLRRPIAIVNAKSAYTYRYSCSCNTN